MDGSVSGAYRRPSMEAMPEKMDKQQPAAPTPPASRPPFLHINVQLVSIWTFCNAVAVIVSVVVAVAYYTLVAATHHYPSQQALCLLPRAANANNTLQVSVSVVPATGMLPQAAAGGALALLLPCNRWRVLVLTIGKLWCSTHQAVAAALGLLLPRHRRRVLRRAAAYTALALTVASHCMFAGTVLVLVRDDPEGLGLFFTIMGTVSVFMCAVIDLLGFLVLHRGGEVELDDDLLGFLRGRED